jgi:hypothetical protein
MCRWQSKPTIRRWELTTAPAPTPTPCLTSHVLVISGAVKIYGTEVVTRRTVERNEETEGFCIKNEIFLKSSIFWNILPCSPLNVNRLSEEHITSILRAEE